MYSLLASRSRLRSTNDVARACRPCSFLNIDANNTLVFFHGRDARATSNLRTFTMRAFRTILIVTIVAGFIAALTAVAGATNWPQWRGPSGQGVSTEKDLPSEWSPTKNIK